MLVIMTLVLFFMGLGTFLIGIFMLAMRSTDQELKTIVNQTAQLAQKGIAEDVAGLVGNASNLLDAMNQLIRTNAGIGVYVTIIGLIIIGVASWLGFQIFMSQQ
jgi:TRAP-type uncharacterized transport system fused permease subunit